MRQKLGMVAFVVALVAVWTAGFLWVRGDFTAPDRTTAANARAKVPAPGTGEKTPSAALPTTSATAPADATSAAASVAASAAANAAAQLPLTDTKPVDSNPDVARPRPRLLPPVAEFNVASFNILGSSHTGRGGHSPGMASGTQRMGGVLAKLAQHDVSIVGIQEFQPDQRAAFNARAGGWTAWPGLTMGRRAGENSVAWRDDTWSVVETNLVNIPYFGGRIRPMPYVLLQHKQTGIKVWVSTFHNPADVHGPAQRWRNEATSREIGLFNRLEQTGYPQFVTGDMNERNEYPCRVTGATPLVPAQGGSCPPNAPVGIDWLMGSPKIAFSAYRSDRAPGTSDHPIVVAHAAVDAVDYPKAFEPDEAAALN